MFDRVSFKKKSPPPPVLLVLGNSRNDVIEVAVRRAMLDAGRPESELPDTPGGQRLRRQESGGAEEERCSHYAIDASARWRGG